MKDRIALLTLFAVLVSMVLISCDERAEDKPEMLFSLEKTSAYSGMPEASRDTIHFVVQLTGDPHQIEQQKVWIDYADAFGTMFSYTSFNTQYVFTDVNGTADGVFRIDPQAAGPYQVVARMDHYDVEQAITVDVLMLPSIEVTIQADSLIPDGSTLYPVQIQLTSETSTVAGFEMTLVSDLVLIDYVLESDENGTASTWIESPNDPGEYTLRIALTDFPHIFTEIVLTFE